MTARPAVFLDRDGTLIVDRRYLGDPDGVELLPSAAEAVRRLNEAGIAAVIVTNQSGIARGIFDEQKYELVSGRVQTLLAQAGARLDASYHCPHHPQISGPCSCRKPGTELHRRAIDALGLDRKRLAFVGDRWHDILPAVELQGLGVLVTSPETPADELRRAQTGALCAASVNDAVTLILRAWSLEAPTR
jgi:D-glycero-D-manno-heptose 1,7-bisphosphate phosphatase